MIVEGDYTFDARRETIWDLLQDPDVMVKAMPGAKELNRTSEDVYEGVMQVGVGPVTAGAFTVKVTLGDKTPPSSYTMTFEGKGPVGFTRGTATVELSNADNGTLMKYRADLKIGGKIAGVGQRVLDAASKAMTRQGLEALHHEVQSRVSGAPAGGTGLTAATGSRRVLWIATAVLLIVMSILLCAPAGMR